MQNEPDATDSHRLSARCLNALVRYSPDLVGLVDVDGSIRYLSRAAVQLFMGEDDDDITEFATRTDFIHPDDLQVMRDAFLQSLQEPGVECGYQIRVDHPDGTEHHVAGKFVNLLADPDVEGIALYCNDVTNHVRLAAQLQQRVEFETVLSETAHDFVDHVADDFTEVIQRALARIGRAAGVDRVIMMNRAHDGSGRPEFHEWCADDQLPPTPPEGQALAAQWIDSPSAHDLLVAEDCTTSTDLSPEQRVVAEAMGINATLSIPIGDARELVAVIGLHSLAPRTWEPDLLGMLDHYAAIHMAAWTRRRVDAEQRAFAATLYDAQTRFEEVFEHAPIGMALADMHGRFFRVNPALCEMLQSDAADLIAHRFSEFTHPDDLTDNTALHDELVSGKRTQYTIEKRYRQSDGNHIWCRVIVSLVHDTNGDPVYEIGQIFDISEQRSVAEALEREARYDALTGLAARKLFLEALERALTDTRRHSSDLGVLFIDLDHFKHVNDTLGHAAGDELLVVGAKRLESVLRATDLACRFGGDEFMVLCPNLESPAVVASLAERVRSVMEQPFRIRGTEVFVGASIGIAIADSDSTASVLVSQADSAAYRAKARGRNRYEVFDDDLRNVIAQRIELEQALRYAIDNDELGLAFQPIISTETNQVRGFEALLRWERPGHGVVMPLDFLPIAEERDLIIPIGYQVLEKACTQLARWQGASPDGSTPTVAVNVSARQFAHPEFGDRVEAIIAAAGVDPRLLTMELTETTLMDDTAATAAALVRMRNLGISLAIDDFGTGYSSLSYLQKMPVNSVKIDRSFVAQLGSTAADATIVAAVIYLSHALGLSVVAEGVETIEHVQALTAFGCDYIQGYYYSRPLAPDVATEFLQTRRVSRTAA